MLKPGIHFGLSVAEYHADPAFSQSGIKTMAISPLQYWDEYINPKKEPKNSTYEMEIGKAFEALLLEPLRFKEEYVEALKLPEYALRTVDDLKGYLREKGEKVTGTKAELTDRIINIDPDAPLADRMEHEFMNAHAGKTIVKSDDWQNIHTMADKYRKHPDSGLLLGGKVAYQVGVVWLEDDVRMKALIDVLRPNCRYDLKTFSNSRRKNIEALVAETITRDYMMQAYTHTRGLYMAIEAIRQRKAGVYGSYDKDFLRELVAFPPEQSVFGFAFVESSRPYNITHRYVGCAGDTLIWNKTEIDYITAVNMYRECMAKFGTENEWRPQTEAKIITDNDVPAYVMSR